MSFNPLLLQDIHTKALLPACTSGEAYILTRSDVQMKLTLKDRTLKGTGTVVLTTHRLVFIKKNDKDFKKYFSSVNVPYSHLDEPKFNQPVFTTNNFSFLVRSDSTGKYPFESQGSMAIYFVRGGASTYLKLFFIFYSKFRNNPNLMSSQNPISEIEGDNCAFIDPSDSTQVYFTQPKTSEVGSQETAETPQEPEDEATQQARRQGRRERAASRGVLMAHLSNVLQFFRF